MNAPSPNPAEGTAEQTVKTAFDCDILTVARDAIAHEEAARMRAAILADPMDDLYKPLGNRDVACVLKAKGAGR